MDNVANMVWVELRKAVRSRIPLWTALGSLFLPLGIGFLIFVARNPAISQKLGLVGAKANLMAYSSTDWPAYLGLFGLTVSVGGFFLFVLATSWVFGREFTDGTLKDLLAVPVPRSNILLAKFIIVAAWSAMLFFVIAVAGFGIGAIIRLPGWAPGVILRGCALMAISAALAMAVTTPFALFASVGRGFLLPLGLAVLIVVMTNLVTVVGWGEYFPWAIPALLMQAKSPLPGVSFWIVALTGLAGMLATYLWWKYADQNR